MPVSISNSNDVIYKQPQYYDSENITEDLEWGRSTEPENRMPAAR